MIIRILIVSLLLTFSPFSMALGQNSPERNDSWSWHGSLNYSYMGRGTYSFFIINTTNEYEIQTRTEFRAAFDLGVTYSLNKNFFSTAGISYIDNGHETRRLVIPGFKESFHKYRAFYITPNIGIGFSTPTFINKINFSLANLWMYNIYAGERSTEPEFSSTDVFNWQNYVSTALSTGLAYQFNNKTSLGFGPKVEVNVTETTKQKNSWEDPNINFLRMGFQLTVRSDI